YPSFEAAVSEFRLSNAYNITCACFGVAGPVKNGYVQASNLPWIIDASVVEREADIATVQLINDLEANAYGLGELEEADLETLTPGIHGSEGNAAVISAGTGLGEAGLFWDGASHRPFAAEGGHADFGPANDLQVELWRYLHQRFGGHVSWERVLSGPGQHNIYEFLREEMDAADASAVITRHGLDGSSPLCRQAVDVFVEIYGAAAGNLALKYLAVSGVYLGGGIAPKILPKLKEPRFLIAFRGKGRLRSLLETIPVRVVLNEKTALLGAGRVAMQNCAAKTENLHV